MTNDRKDEKIKAGLAYCWKMAFIVGAVSTLPLMLFGDKYPWLILVPMMIGFFLAMKRYLKIWNS